MSEKVRRRYVTRRGNEATWRRVAHQALDRLIDAEVSGLRARHRTGDARHDLENAINAAAQQEIIR